MLGTLGTSLGSFGAFVHTLFVKLDGASEFTRRRTHQIEWSDYLDRMRRGIDEHGPVREGVYAVTGYEGVGDHARRLGQQTGEGAGSTGGDN